MPEDEEIRILREQLDQILDINEKLLQVAERYFSIVKSYEKIMIEIGYLPPEEEIIPDNIIPFPKKLN